MVDSIIKIFESTYTDFSSNGIGPLTDAISCIVIEERNGLFEIQMEYPITGKRYEEIQLRRIILTKSNPYSDLQPFRIYSITKPINGIITVYAEHISYDTKGYGVMPFVAESLDDAFNKIKSFSIVNSPFMFWTDKNVQSKMITKVPNNMRSLLGGIEGSILDLYGGEYEFDVYTIKLWKHRGSDNGVVIRYGKNLIDLDQEEECSNVYTGVYPYWYSEFDDLLVQLPEKVINVEGNYNFSRILILDLSGRFENIPTEDQLRLYTQRYIKNNEIGIPKVSLTVSFIDLGQTEEYENIRELEKVQLCDTVMVEFIELGVKASAKCVKTKYDVLTDRYDSIELGNVKTDLASTIVENEKNTKHISSTTVNNQYGLNVTYKQAEENKENISQNTNDISTLSQNANGLSQRITQNTNDISTLSQNANGLSQRITQNTNDISTLSQNIQNLKQAINKINSSLPYKITIQDKNMSIVDEIRTI